MIITLWCITVLQLQLQLYFEKTEQEDKLNVFTHFENQKFKTPLLLFILHFCVFIFAKMHIIKKPYLYKKQLKPPLWKQSYN